MGSSSSRGQIEEFSIDFVNEATKVIQFEADRLDVAGFLGPPVVKLLSVENNAKTLYQHQVLFDGGLDLVQIPGKSQPPGFVFGTVEPLGNTIQHQFEALQGFIPASYAKTLANPGNLQRHGLRLGKNKQRTIAPIKDFESIADSFTGDAKIEFLFQCKFTNTDNHSLDDLRIYFGNKAWLNTSEQTPNTAGMRMTNIKATAQVLRTDGSGWTNVNLPGSMPVGSYIELQMDKMITAGSHSGTSWKTNSENNFVWIKIIIENDDPTLTGYTEILQNFGGITIVNSFSQSTETVDIANPMFFISPNGATVFSGSDLLDHDLVNPNVMVSFRAVSRTGMTILTSSRFTGTIKYLVSFAG